MALSRPYRAHTAWETAPKKLLEEFSQGKFPNEFLYYNNQQAVGWISLSVRSEYVEGASRLSACAYIEGIAVLPDFRQGGIASSLMDFAKSWAAEQSCSQLASDCDVRNVDSQLFHIKMGFEEVSRNVHYLLDLEKEGEKNA